MMFAKFVKTLSRRAPSTLKIVSSTRDYLVAATKIGGPMTSSSVRGDRHRVSQGAKIYWINGSSHRHLHVPRQVSLSLSYVEACHFTTRTVGFLVLSEHLLALLENCLKTSPRSPDRSLIRYTRSLKWE